MKSDITLWAEFVRKHERTNIQYRGFEIHPGNNYEFPWSYVHEDYDGAPDGNDTRCGDELSIDDCKKAIDNYYDTNVIYAVHHSDELAPAKFYLISDAIAFCRYWKLDLTRIIPYLSNWEFSFDSI
jgi:hypothetical protein